MYLLSLLSSTIKEGHLKSQMSFLSLIGDPIVSDYLFMPVRLQCQYLFLEFITCLYHFFLFFLQFNTFFAFHYSSRSKSI